MRSRLLVVTLFLFALTAAGAAAESLDATQVIGMGLQSVVGALGLPQRMFTFRGSQESLDDVVFYYPDHTYLFWYKDRVWQVRYDRRATATVHGVSLGMSRAEVEAAVTDRAIVTDGMSLFFDLDSTGFPVRVRLVLTEDAVSDIYVYRSDF